MTTAVQGPVSAPSAVGTGAMPTTGRWGWYRDHEGREWRRVSTLVKKVETDTHHLDLWKRRQVVEGLAIRDDLVLAVKAMGRPPAEGWTRSQKSDLNKIVETATEAAKQRDGAVRGTAMHTLTERLDRGEPLEQVAAGLPAVAGQCIRAYAAMRTLNGWRTVEIERTVVCDELEVAGTFDRIDFVPGLAALLGPGTCQHRHSDGDHGEAVVYDGELPVIVDVKTEEQPWSNGLHIGPQLGIYSRARRMWRPPGEYVPAPCVRQDVAIVVHLHDGHARPYFVNLAEGWEAAIAAYEQMNRESRAKRKLGAAGAWFVPVPNVIEPKPAQTFVEHAIAADYANPHRPGAATPAGPSTFGVDGTTIASATPMSDGTTHYSVGDVGEQVAVRDPASGLVSWQAAVTAEQPADPVAATMTAAARMFDEHDELRIKLIEQIWKTETVSGLGILWNMAKDRGVLWAGPVAMAGDARRRQIECPQRALHTGSGKCACGWMTGQIA